jgi:aryl-alcohol dehydrogenase
MQARAAVMPERHGRWTIETLEVAEPGPQEVLVRVVASGICQTDVHARDGFFPIPCPAVYGHEGAGVIERVGRAVTTLKPGDHVLMANPSCGACPECLAGFETYCSKAPILKHRGYRADGQSLSFRRGEEPIYGSFFQQSSFASCTIAMARNTIRVPDEAPLDILAAFPCGVNTGRRRGHERTQAQSRRLLCGVRHGDRRLRGAAGDEARGLRPHHRGRRVR